MKKAFAVFFILILGISMLTACGGGAGGSNPSASQGSSEPSAADNDGTSYGIDLASTDVQPMSEERATVETLSETVNDWLEGGTIFPTGTELSARTYQDFANHIGCDATEFYLDTSTNARVYTWKAEGKDISILSVWFAEDDGVWNLSMSGSSNLL